MERKTAPKATARRDLGSWDTNVGAVRVVFGAGRLQELGPLVAAVGRRRILVVTDPGVSAAGHAGAAVDSLRAAGLEVEVFDGVEENPTSEHVVAGTAFARRQEPEMLVAVGGGSAMDCAKGINFLLTNGGEMEQYRGYGKASEPMLPSFGVPTTAGTGSEAQSFALISRPDDHSKMACGDPKARFQTVLLDPDLLCSLPESVAATTGLDAVAHAVESYVTRKGNPVSRMFAKEAWRLLAESFEAIVQTPEELSSRQAMLLGAHLAGAAIELSMLGAAHACANPLTARRGVVHGRAVALMLPSVVRFNGAPGGPVDTRYRQLLVAAGRVPQREGNNAAALARCLTKMCTVGGLPTRLRDIGIGEEELPELAAAASKEWTAAHNPLPVTADDLLEIYQGAW